MKRAVIFGALALAFAAGIGVVGCAATKLPNVPTQPTGPAARPPALGPFGDQAPVESAEAWRQERAPKLLSAFEETVFGRYPDSAPVVVESKKVMEEGAFGGAARVEQWTVRLGEGGQYRMFDMAVVAPNDAPAPVPVIMVQGFCPNGSSMPKMGLAPPRVAGPGPCDQGWARPLVSLVFGSALIAPPFEEIVARGYAVARFFPSEIVPDDAQSAEAALAKLTPPETPPELRPGAIAAWAWTYSRALDALAADERFDANRIVAWGHSRNGKSALLAAAEDQRIAAVIALQPGTGGAALTRDKVGESVGEITASYPHWFAPAYARFAGREEELPVDQHQLIALIAPRPVLIGAGRRDQWSDPHGTYRAMEGASPVYELLGAKAFAPEGMRNPSFSSPLVFYMRPGLHGVHTEDWDHALDFLDAFVKAR